MKTFPIIDEVQTPLREAVEAQPSELFKAQTRMVDLIKKNVPRGPQEDESITPDQSPQFKVRFIYLFELFFFTYLLFSSEWL